MKTATATILASLAALAAVADSSEIQAPLGEDNIAFGYNAAYHAMGKHKNVIVIGTLSAASTISNTNCVFIGNSSGTGSWFLRDVVAIGSDVRAGSYNTNCVFIGAPPEVTAGIRHVKDAVVIGNNVLVHTNGVTTIKGFSGGGGSGGISATTATNIAHGVAFSLEMTNTIRAVASSAQKLPSTAITNELGEAFLTDTEGPSGTRYLKIGSMDGSSTEYGVFCANDVNCSDVNISNPQGDLSSLGAISGRVTCHFEFDFTAGNRINLYSGTTLVGYIDFTPAQ